MNRGDTISAEINYFAIHMKTIVSALCLASVLSTPVLADVSLRYVSGSEVSVLRISAGKARMQAGSQQDNALLFDSQSGKLIALNGEQQQYIDVDEVMGQMGGLRDKMSNMMAQAMEGRSAEEKAAMGNLMGGLMGGLLGKKAPKAAEPVAATVSRSGETDTVNGFACEKVMVIDAEHRDEMCIAKPGELNISDADFAVMERLMKKMKSMSAKVRQFVDVSSPVAIADNLGGVPVKAYGKAASELQAVDNTAIDATLFDIPTGYEAMRLPTM